VTVEDRLGGQGESLTLDLPGTTFWPALDAIARAARGRVDLYPRDGKLALVRKPVGYVEPPVSYSGLFRTSVKRVTASRHMETGASAYFASLEVAWEPTLEPLFLVTSPHGLTVRDDQGHELSARKEESTNAPVDGPSVDGPPVDGRFALEFDVPLPGVPRSASRLALLEGKLTAIAPSKVVTFAFDSLDRIAESAADSPLRTQSQEGVNCRIRKVQHSRDRLTVQVAIDYPPSLVKLGSYQSKVVNNEMVLESQDGSKRLTTGEYELEKATDRQAVISYHFTDKNSPQRGRPADWKVRYRTPASLVVVPLTFSFKDVPLP
jgi:hypothetical protein